MTIKQHGGVFGRNPTFNNATIDGTLTVDQIVEKTGAAGITLDGVTLKDGNVVLASGKGIDFSATAGTGTSELFDDYEEGTWTPTVAGSTTAGDYTVTPTGAVYTKVGRFVHASAYFVINENSAGTGALLIGGLPFSSLANSRISGSFLSTNATFDAACVYAIPAQSTGGATTVVHIKQVRSATTPLNLPVTALAATSVVELHVNYTTS